MRLFTKHWPRVILTAVAILWSTPTQAGVLNNKILQIYKTCIGEELILQARVWNSNAEYSVGQCTTYVEVKKGGTTVHTSPSDVREIDKSQDFTFDMNTGYSPTETGTLALYLHSNAQFNINGAQENISTTVICAGAPCPDRPSVSATEIYLGTGSTGQITYTAQPNCCYRIKFTIVTGRDAVSAHAPSAWTDVSGGSLPVSVTVDRAKWGSSYIVGRVDYQTCDGSKRGSDYILIRDGTEQQASAPTPQPAGVTSGQTPQAGMDGDPVNTALREVSMPIATVDIEQIGRLPVRNMREYLSNLPAAVNTDNGFGPGWTHSLDYRTVVTDHEAYVIGPRGLTTRFRNTGKAYQLDWPKDGGYSFVRTADGSVFGDAGAHNVLEFDDLGQLSAIHDGYGGVIAIIVENRQIQSAKLPSGKGLTFTHNADGRITSITNGSATVNYGYTNGILTSFTDATGNTITYSYSKDWLLHSVIDADGHTAFATGYDAGGKVSGQDFGNGFTIGFSQAGNVSSITYPMGVTFKHTHDQSNRLTAVEDPDGNTARFEYDVNGHRTKLTDRDGAVTQRIYVGGHLTELRNPDGGVWKWTYRSRPYLGVTLDELEKVEIPGGASYNFGFDAQFRPNRVTYPDGESIDLTYNALGVPLTAKGRGMDLSMTYNADGLITGMTDGRGTNTQYGYTTSGLLNRITRSGAPVWTAEYDAAGRKTSVNSTFGGMVGIGHHKSGQISDLTDGEGRTWTRTYDARGRLDQATNPLGGGLQMGWMGPIPTTLDFGNGQSYSVLPDMHGRLGQLVNPTGAEWTFDYDLEGVIRKLTQPGDASWTFTSNTMGKPLTMTTPDNLTYTAAYDQLGRRTSLTLPGGTDLSTMFRPDLTGSTTTFGDLSLQARYTPEDGTLSESFGGFSLTTKLKLDTRALTSTLPSGRERTVNFNANDRVTGITLPGGVNYSWVFVDGLPTAVRFGAEERQIRYDNSLATIQIDNRPIARDDAGNVIGYNGVEYGRGPNGEITSMKLSGGRQIDYTRDARGYVTGVKDWLGGETQLAYDAQGHLCDVTYPNGFHVQYTWSPGGAITGVNYGDLGSIRYTHDNAGRITEVTRDLGFEPDFRVDSRMMTYDADNRLEGGSYDSRENFSGAPGTPVVTYGGFGATKISWGATDATVATDPWGYGVKYTSDKLSLDLTWTIGTRFRYPVEVKENNETTTLVGLPNLGVVLYGIDSKGARHHYLEDGQGNVVLETNDDNQVTGGRIYSPYGATIGKTGNPWHLGYKGAFGGFTYQHEDGDQDLVELGGRMYFPELGRYGLNFRPSLDADFDDTWRALRSFIRSTDPRTANGTTLPLDPLANLRMGFDVIETSEAYRSGCEIDEEDLTLSDARFRVGLDLGYDFRPTLPGGLNGGFYKGFDAVLGGDQFGGSTSHGGYTSPTFGGFTLGGPAGRPWIPSEDDAWDAALRYAGEFGGFRLGGPAPLTSGDPNAFGHSTAEALLEIFGDGPPRVQLPQPPSTTPSPESNRETPTKK